MGGEKHPVSYAENTKRSKKSQALGMTTLLALKVALKGQVVVHPKSETRWGRKIGDTQRS